MKNKMASLNHQSGVVLAISLIMLVLLTLIGITGMNVTILEEKMANNLKDQNMAFQAAEAALRGGEANIEDIVAVGAFDGSGGLFGEDDALPDFLLTDSWSSSNSIEFTASGITGITTQPRYYVKHVSTGEASGNSSINITGYGDVLAGAAVSYFTITSRGTGGTNNSQVFLRGYYGKRF